MRQSTGRKETGYDRDRNGDHDPAPQERRRYGYFEYTHRRDELINIYVKKRAIIGSFFIA